MSGAHSVHEPATECEGWRDKLNPCETASSSRPGLRSPQTPREGSSKGLSKDTLAYLQRATGNRAVVHILGKRVFPQANNVIQRLESDEAMPGARIKDEDGNIYHIDEVEGEKKIVVKATLQTRVTPEADEKISFTPGEWDDKYSLIRETPDARPVPVTGGTGKDEPKPGTESSAKSGPEATSQPAPPSSEKVVKTRKGPKDYPPLVEFTFDLPNGAGTLVWKDDKAFYTEHGWMSQNLYFDTATSAKLGAQPGKQLSAHAIIAIKYPYPDAKLVRLNPHVTLRDFARQQARDEREKQSAEGVKGYQKQKKSGTDKLADKEDALYSNQFGMKSERLEKAGQVKLRLTKDREALGFNDEWLRALVASAASAADDSSWTFEVGTARHKF
jgi:hypothetical protein